MIGVTDFAQNQLGDIVFVELPEVGAELEAGVPFGTIESVKAVSDLFAPISGEVLPINERLEDQPERVNESCYGDGWLIKLEPRARTRWPTLIDARAYLAFAPSATELRTIDDGTVAMPLSGLRRRSVDRPTRASSAAPAPSESHGGRPRPRRPGDRAAGIDASDRRPDRSRPSFSLSSARLMCRSG